MATATSSITTRPADPDDDNNIAPGELGPLGAHSSLHRSYSAFSPPSSPARRRDRRDSDLDEPAGHDPHDHHDDHFGFFAKLGAIELENKGSVARDHLALGYYPISLPPCLSPSPCGWGFCRNCKDSNGGQRKDIPGLAAHQSCLCFHWFVPPPHARCHATDAPNLAQA